MNSAGYDDVVTIKTWVIEIRRSLLRIGYEALRGDTLLASGETIQVLVRKAPTTVRARFRPRLRRGSRQEGRRKKDDMK